MLLILRKLRSLRSRLDRLAAKICRRSGFLASVYYSVFSSGFRREHRAMLAGRHQYFKDLGSPSATSALLRRNIHRLEKGLLMRPLRDLFALDYIDETVRQYCRLVDNQNAGFEMGETVEACQTNIELNWAYDVLSKYFETTRKDPRTANCRKLFESTEKVKPSVNQQMVPYRRDLDRRINLDYETFYELSRRRRSVRWFLSKSVPREAIDKAILIAAQSPSACNRQPFYFRVIDDPDLVGQVARLPMGTSGYADNIPVLVVVIGRLRNYPFERDRHLIYIDGSLATMALVYGLEVQELATCCINWPDIDSRENAMASLLQLEDDERPIMCVAIGYPDPDGLVAYSAKKPLDILRRYNFE